MAVVLPLPPGGVGELEVVLVAKLRVPVVGNLKLSPFADFFLFDSKLLAQRGYNLVFGVSLEFSQLWKPVY